ncbi:MAG: hypothetical protein F6K41_03480 [Symploca sp. SIO3E6]|nr:hypothetical protein [Caldora sp. SIO3E6]
MSSIKKIICLSNSWKHHERCIAGIDLDTSKWIRPVCDALYPEDGRIPKKIRLVAGREPQLLDILAIPLSSIGQDFGFECENLSVLAGDWQCVGRVEPNAVFKYCGNFSEILHNRGKYVNPSYLTSLPFPKRRTLQLVHVVNFSVEKGNSTGWRGIIQSANSPGLTYAKITDPVLIDKLDFGYQPKNNCLVTMSLSMPYKPRPDWEGEAPCWKLISAVIEL